MRRIALVLFAVALLAAPAQAHTKRLTVDDTANWTTPQRFDADEVVVLKIYANGHRLHNRTYLRDGLMYRGRGLLVEQTSSQRKRGPLRFRFANFRDRDAQVRLVYRRL